MEFFTSAIDTLKTVVIGLGAGLAVWGVINLLEGYGNDNPGAKSQGIKQLMAGAGVAIVGSVLVPKLSQLFSTSEITNIFNYTVMVASIQLKNILVAAVFNIENIATDILAFVPKFF